MGRVGLEWSGWRPSNWAHTRPFLFVRNLLGDDFAVRELVEPQTVGIIPVDDFARGLSRSLRPLISFGRPEHI